HDYLGFQYYFTYPLAFAWRRPTNFFIQEMVDLVPGAAAMMGENRPEGLYTWARWFSRYGKPMVVTENGLLETVERQRPAYLLRALAALHRAIQEGADVRAYYHWSLVDNFEWAEGYAARFGLVHVDFATQQRTVKRSGWLYAEIARANAITPEMAADIDPALVGELFGSQGALSSSAGGDS
ncbi:MAG: family 1 glycosylhydrolase, partial [Anaerolineae bacterium]|nr:family 1 glycosylhydrolase [Anaerolineae bacterium]